jgi:hypothetical protein
MSLFIAADCLFLARIIRSAAKEIRFLGVSLLHAEAKNHFKAPPYSLL